MRPLAALLLLASVALTLATPSLNDGAPLGTPAPTPGDTQVFPLPLLLNAKRCITPQDALPGSRVLVRLGTLRMRHPLQLGALRIHPPRVAVQALDWNPGVQQWPDGGP